jgi:hypothetical protein
MSPFMCEKIEQKECEGCSVFTNSNSTDASDRKMTMLGPERLERDGPCLTVETNEAEG